MKNVYIYSLEVDGLVVTSAIAVQFAGTAFDVFAFDIKFTSPSGALDK